MGDKVRCFPREPRPATQGGRGHGPANPARPAPRIRVTISPGPRRTRANPAYLDRSTAIAAGIEQPPAIGRGQHLLTDPPAADNRFPVNKTIDSVEDGSDHDPYIRRFHQARNLMELIEGIAASKDPADEVVVKRPDRGVVPAALGRRDIEAFLNRLAYQQSAGRISGDARLRACRELRKVLTTARAMGLTRPGGPGATCRPRSCASSAPTSTRSAHR